MAASQLVGMILALTSALVYGSADFFGGLASRKQSAFAVLTLTALVGTFGMALLGLIFRESWPSPAGILWGSLGGLCGLFGLVLLYFGLAKGNAAIVSPISGVVSASIPVIVSALVISLPTLTQLIGFLIALPGIALVTQANKPETSSSKSSQTSTMNYPLKPIQGVLVGGLAGLFFGLFFICLAQLKQGTIFGPLMFSKFFAFIIGSGIFLITSKKGSRSLHINTPILLAGILDGFANMLYLLASRFTRLDIAAVLSSLYPLGTVLLQTLFLKERINRIQWLGIGLCLMAIMLITS